MSIETLTRTIMSKMDGIGKWQADFFVHLVLVWLQLRGRYSFENLCRQGKYSSFTYRKWFRQGFEFATFNHLLITNYTGKERIVAFDPSYISKSGKHTYGVGYFWSGCAQAMKKGLEIAGLAAVDVANQSAFHYLSTQTVVAEGQSLLAYYGTLITSQAGQLLALSKYLVVDAYFSKYSFIETVTASKLEVITRLRDDAVLLYPYLGPKRAGRGAPKKYAGKLKGKQLDLQYFTPCLKEKDFACFQALLYSKALKRLLNVVIMHTYKEDGSIKGCKIFVSTDLSLPGSDLWLYYHLRFQQEFLFRDGKQFLGLTHCQSRDKDRLAFQFNFSLTLISLVKLVHWMIKPVELRGAFSLQDIKTHYANHFLLERFFVAFGICPKSAKNNPEYDKLLNYAKIAA
jgi:Transposase DDE domain